MAAPDEMAESLQPLWQDGGLEADLARRFVPHGASELAYATALSGGVPRRDMAFRVGDVVLTWEAGSGEVRTRLA